MRFAFERGDAGEKADGRFAGAVGRSCRMMGLNARRRGDVYNAPAAMLFIAVIACRVPRNTPSRFVAMTRRQSARFSSCDGLGERDASAVDADVQTAPVGQNPGHRCLPVGFRCHIQPDGDGLAPPQRRSRRRLLPTPVRLHRPKRPAPLPRPAVEPWPCRCRRPRPSRGRLCRPCAWESVRSCAFKECRSSPTGTNTPRADIGSNIHERRAPTSANGMARSGEVAPRSLNRRIKRLRRTMITAAALSR
jgi:hypothetical protein